MGPSLDEIGASSRYCTPRQCPDPETEPERLLEFLHDEGRRLTQPGVLSPASDAFVLFMSRYRDELKDCFRFNLPAPEVVDAVVDKRAFYDLADRYGVACATTFYPESMDDVHHIKHELDYPAFIKPYHSHRWNAALPDLGKGIKVFSPQELVAGYERVFATDVRAMVQAIIQGPITNIWCVWAYINGEGEPIAAFTNRKLRQHPSEFGQSTAAESIRDPEFCEMGMDFLRQIDYRGFAELEFKRDDRDRKWKVTDLNLRWAKAINLPTSSGIDFPIIHYLDLTGRPPAPQFDFREGVRWLEAGGDFTTAWSLMRAGELSPWAWGGSWLGSHSFAILAMDDLRPLLKEYRYGRRMLQAPINMWRRR